MAVSQAEPSRFSDPKLTAAALAYGGRLLRVEDTPAGRLDFFVGGIPSDFLMLIANDEITISAKRFISAMETVLGLIAERKRSRR